MYCTILTVHIETHCSRTQKLIYARSKQTVVFSNSYLTVSSFLTVEAWSLPTGYGTRPPNTNQAHRDINKRNYDVPCSLRNPRRNTVTWISYPRTLPLRSSQQTSNGLDSHRRFCNFLEKAVSLTNRTKIHSSLCLSYRS